MTPRQEVLGIDSAEGRVVPVQPPSHVTQLGFNRAKHHTAIAYLIKQRGIPESAINQLNIHWVDHQTAISERYGYGQLATSPDGLVIFPLRFEEDDGKLITAARNFYQSDQSRQQHLAIINRHLFANGHSPEKRTPKYLVPKGDRNKNYPFYDPFALLHQNLNGALPEPDLCTEDVIGVIKAALKGYRALSSFGVWLVDREHMEDASSDLTWLHPFRNKFGTYLADSDALVRPSAFCALVRTGYVVGCKVGTFPGSEAKVGLDELIDQAGDLRGAIAQAQDVSQFVLESLPKVKAALEKEYSPSEADIRRGRFYHQIIRELSRHLLDGGTFILRYGSAFKKLGYSTPELRKIFTEVQRYHQPDNPDSPRLLAKNLAKGSLKDRLLFEAKTGLWYSYQETTGHWEQVNERLANKLIDSAIEKAIKRQSFTRAYLSETKDFLASQLLIPQWEPTLGIINFQDGVLDLRGPEPVLNPYNPSYRLTYCLPRDYGDGANQKTPVIDAFLMGLTGNRPSEIKKLDCFAAAVLRGMTYLQIYLALIGDPGAGKGTWVNFLTSLIGLQACYSTTLESFCGNNFDAANCYGKQLVIFNDADQYSGNISKFLQFTGGDLVRGEIKGGASFNFKAEGFILITANKPVFVRSHPGLNRRTCLVQCVAPKKRKADTLLLGKLLAEAEAYTSKILALEPAEIDRVLLDRGENNPRERLQLWQNLVEIDSIASWADEYLVQNSTAKALIGSNAADTETLFGSYCQFCQETKRQAKAFNSFSRDLIEALTSVLGWDITKVREGSGHGTERPVVMLGIRLRNSGDLTITEQLQKNIDEADEKKPPKSTVPSVPFTLPGFESCPRSCPSTVPVTSPLESSF